MLLGSAETLGKNNQEFEILDSKLKFFKRTQSTVTPELSDFPSAFSYNKKTAIENKIMPKSIENIQTLADQILIQNFSPASVFVNDKGDILYITGRTGKYLEPVAGKANWNIHAMAREGLKNELPNAFRKALQDNNPVMLRNIKIGTNGNVNFVNVTIQRIENPDAMKGLVMIVFTDLPMKKEEDNSFPKKENQNVFSFNYHVPSSNHRRHRKTCQSIRNHCSPFSFM